MSPLRSASAVLLASLLGAAAGGQEKPADFRPTLYVVPYAHLDTQWRWSYPQVIREFLPNTMRENLALIAKYPNYVFNFGGSRRFEMMKEYYPSEYAKVVRAVKAGRWSPAPASVDETETNVVSGESVLRNVLYGNAFSRREFGLTSAEFMRPDSFGFPYSLPTLLKHAGLQGFSTQKLTWGSAVGVPFNVGMWRGPDGSEILSALNATSYVSRVEGDLSREPEWFRRLKADPAGVDYRYYGTGDTGGAPDEASIANMERSLKGDGPVRVVQGSADRMFRELSPETIEKLPRYEGELLLTQHSSGSLTSHSEMKRWNRQSELLADFAERASVAAAVWTGAAYPRERLERAWTLAIGNQMHDTLPGTVLPKGYEYAQNDATIARKEFATMASDGVGAVAAAMDTRAQGSPLVVANPLSFAREEVVEARVPFSGPVTVFGPDGRAVPTQVTQGPSISDEADGDGRRILFLARVPANGFAAFDARPVASEGKASGPTAKGNVLENERFRVTLNDAGDVASIYDKAAGREALKAPAGLDLQYEKPRDWPAWNMDWTDRQKPPYARVGGPAKIVVVESGPVRATLRVERGFGSSAFVTYVSLARGGDRVEVRQDVDWSTRETSLKAAFPLAVGNPKAAYGMAVGAIERPNNNERAYEAPVHGWMDVTSADGSYGVGLLSPTKYGSDKPADDVLRLTLLYSPGVRGGYQDQAETDFGRHRIPYAIVPHAGDWRLAGLPAMAESFGQPMRAFATAAHSGPLGRRIALAAVSSPNVAIQALKAAEDGDGVIVRLRELSGKATPTDVTFARAIFAAEEVDGQERRIGPATVTKGVLTTDVRGYGLRAFRVRMPSPRIAPPVTSRPIPLRYDLDAVSPDAAPADGAMAPGLAYPAETFPRDLVLGGARFRFGPTAAGKPNALIAHGQTLSIPEGFDRVEVIAAATEDVSMEVTVGSRRERVNLPAWEGYVGQWDQRQWKGEQPEMAYAWKLPYVGLTPGFQKDAELAWFVSHRHAAIGGNEPYRYAYLFRRGFALPRGQRTITLPNDSRVRIFAVSATRGAGRETRPSLALTDTLEDRTAGMELSVVPTFDPAGNGATVAIRPKLYGRLDDIRYTLDGTTPGPKSPRYEGPIFLGRPTTVTASAPGTATVRMRVEARDDRAPKLLLARRYEPDGTTWLTFDERIALPAAGERRADILPDGRTVRLTSPGTPPKITDLAGNRPDGSAPFRYDALVPNFEKVSTLSVEGSATSTAPTDGASRWTLTMWVKAKTAPLPRTLIAGFGRAQDGQNGTGRYLSVFPSGIQFWSANEDVPTKTPLPVGRWAMLAATFDGEKVRLYLDGEPIGSGPARLSPDESTVRWLPLDAWEGERRFDGEVRGLRIWPEELPAATIRGIFGGEKD